MRLINLLPHPVNFYRFSDLYKYRGRYYPAPGCGPFRIIPVSGVIANVEEVVYIQKTLIFPEDNEEVFVYGAGNFKVTGLPDPKEGVSYIVSHVVNLYAQDRSDLVVPYGNVYSADRKNWHRIIGCRNLIRRGK